MKVYNYSSLNRQQHVASSRRKPIQKRARTHLGLFNNPFKIDFGSLNSIYFQVAGILMITVGAVISFQTLVDISSPETAADSKNNRDSVRVLTNFETQTKRSAVPKVEVINTTPAPTKDAPATPTVKPEQFATDTTPETKEIELTNAPTTKQDVYIVLAGDSLASVAAMFGIEEAKFIEANKLTPPYVLQADQKLLVPITN